MKDARVTIKKLLESSWALPSVDKGSFTRLHDDTDGEDLGRIGVHRAIDGDMYVWQDNQPWLRFRSYSGGGASLRTHNALRILAEAIRLDEIERTRK